MNAVKVLELVNNDKLIQLKELAEKTIREKNAKKKGGSTLLQRQNAMERLVKKEKKKGNNKGSGHWMQDEYQCFTDGYIAVMLVDFLQSDNTVQGIDLTGWLEKFGYFFPIDGNITAKAQNVQDLRKAASKADKELDLNKQEKYLLKVNQSYYKPELIIKAIKILGGTVEYYNKSNEQEILFLRSENGKAVVMPYRFEK